MTTQQIINEVMTTAKLPDNFNSQETLILGIGNKSRGDDGLGWAFIKHLEDRGDFKGVIEYRYLLLVEDAQLIANYANVVFVDAFHGDLPGGFTFERTVPGQEFEFSTHIIPPASILYLTNELYDKQPGAWTMAISGEQWELGSGLSRNAKSYLAKATKCFRERVEGLI